jgi:hypothetical protein
VKDIIKRSIKRNFKVCELSFYKEWGSYVKGDGYEYGFGYMDGNGK